MFKKFGERARDKQSDRIESPFAHWSRFDELIYANLESELFTSFPAGDETVVMKRKRHDEFSPVIVVGLGKTGEIILDQWLHLLSESGLNNKNFSACLLHNDNSSQATDFPVDIIELGVFDLFRKDITTTDVDLSSREYQQHCFNHVENLPNINTYLSRMVQTLRSDIRVYVAASLREPIIGVIGDLLTLLHQIRKNSFFQIDSVTAILTLDVPDNTLQLDDADIYAALREIGRFAIKGVQVLNPTVRDFSEIVDANLIDHIFLTDQGNNTPANGGQGDFGRGTAQHMSEFLFALVHPSAAMIWEHLTNVQTRAASIQEDIDDVVVHTYDIATLYFPTGIFRDYASRQFAKAVLYGHNQERGLFSSANSQIEITEVVSAWMQDRPYDDEFFQWLFRSADPDSKDFYKLPILDQRFGALFVQKIIYHLNQFLYPSDMYPSGTLVDAWRITQWLKNRCEKVISDLGEPETIRNAPTNVQAFSRLVKEIEGALIDLDRQIVHWIKFYAPGFYSEQTVQTSSQDSANPFESRASSPARKVEPSNPFETVTRQTSPDRISKIDLQPISLRKVLDDQLTEKAAELSQAASGNFRQSMLSDSQQTNNVYKAEIGKLYADLPLDTHLENARKRVGWHFSVHKQTNRISLDVVCLPYNWQKNADKEGALFSIQQADRFLGQLIQYCEYELRNVSTHITTAWFDENVEPQVEDFLARNLTLLGYDAEKLHKEFDSEVGYRFGYLVARNDALANKYAVSTFSHLPDETVNPIASGERTRISKIEITANIPLATVTKYLDAYQDYKFADARHLHLYPQEQNAKYFEKRIRSLGWGQQDIRLTPQITMMLADKSLVDLFFQALFTGVIKHHAVEGILGEEQWGIVPLSEFIQVDLAAIQEGILGAFRSFVIELPNTNLEMPHPFHPRLRQQYLETIRNEVQKRQSIQEYQKYYGGAKDKLLPEIEKLGKSDTCQRDLAEIMKVELESPWDFTY